MSAGYVPVSWNRNKWIYDALLLLAMGLYIWIFLRVAPGFQDVTRPVDGSILRMRAFGSLAFLMLTFILCIGPLARLDRRFLPLLYNRRHFGVLTCAVALVHAGHVLGWYYAFSPTKPLAALLGSNTSFDLFVGFPFEVFGIAALAVMVMMAVTSHDFWLHYFGAPLWKALHMAVYGAYACVVAHVALGYLQDTDNPAFAIVVAICVGVVCVLHVIAGSREGLRDKTPAPAAQGSDPYAGWIALGTLDRITRDLPDGRALVVTPEEGERIAVFRKEDQLGAISHACAHQNGPLGEGRIVFGCVTCPWHGFQYRLEDGCAPPPFTEKVPTYTMVVDETGQLWLDPTPLPAGTARPLTDLPKQEALHGSDTVPA